MGEVWSSLHLCLHLKAHPRTRLSGGRVSATSRPTSTPEFSVQVWRSRRRLGPLSGRTSALRSKDQRGPASGTLHMSKVAEWGRWHSGAGRGQERPILTSSVGPHKGREDPELIPLVGAAEGRQDLDVRMPRIKLCYVCRGYVHKRPARRMHGPARKTLLLARELLTDDLQLSATTFRGAPRWSGRRRRRAGAAATSWRVRGSRNARRRASRGRCSRSPLRISRR